ncbi:MAG: hypothetical protein K6E75_04390 [Lachnospiraceae bacterium]|nr:hypothetical protein [Lachnospiraceae bacterium]
MKEAEQGRVIHTDMPKGMQFDDFFEQPDEVTGLLHFQNKPVTKEDIVNMLFFYAIGKKKMTIQALIGLNPEEKKALGAAFVEDAKKDIEPEPTLNQNVRTDLVWYGENCANGFSELTRQFVLPKKEEMATSGQALEAYEAQYALFDRMTDHFQNRVKPLFLEPNKDRQYSRDKRENNSFGSWDGAQYLVRDIKQVIDDHKAVAGIDKQMSLSRRGIRKLFYEGEMNASDIKDRSIRDGDTNRNYEKQRDNYALDWPETYISLSDDQWQKVLDTPLENLQKEDPELFDEVVVHLARVPEGKYFRDLSDKTRRDREKRIDQRIRQREREIYQDGVNPDHFLPKGWEKDAKIKEALKTMGIDPADRDSMSLLVTNFLVSHSLSKITKIHTMSFEEEAKAAKELSDTLQKKTGDQLKEWYCRIERQAMRELVNNKDFNMPGPKEDIYSGNRADEKKESETGAVCRYADRIIRDVEKRMKDPAETVFRTQMLENGNNKNLDTTYMLAAMGRHFEQTNHQEEPYKGHKKYFKSEVIRRHAMPFVGGRTIDRIHKDMPIGNGKMIYRMLDHEFSEEYKAQKVTYEKFMDGNAYKSAVQEGRDSLGNAVKNELALANNKAREEVEAEKSRQIHAFFDGINQNGAPGIKEMEIYKRKSPAYIGSISRDDEIQIQNDFYKLFKPLSSLENYYEGKDHPERFICNFYIDGKNVYESAQQAIRIGDKEDIDRAAKVMIMNALVYNKEGLTYKPFGIFGEQKEIKIEQEVTVRDEIRKIQEDKDKEYEEGLRKAYEEKERREREEQLKRERQERENQERLKRERIANEGKAADRELYGKAAARINDLQYASIHAFKTNSPDRLQDAFNAGILSKNDRADGDKIFDEVFGKLVRFNVSRENEKEPEKKITEDELIGQSFMIKQGNTTRSVHDVVVDSLRSYYSKKEAEQMAPQYYKSCVLYGMGRSGNEAELLYKPMILNPVTKQIEREKEGHLIGKPAAVATREQIRNQQAEAKLADYTKEVIEQGIRIPPVAAAKKEQKKEPQKEQKKEPKKKPEIEEAGKKQEEQEVLINPERMKDLLPPKGELMREYENAMQQFQTRRASFFTQESKEHESLRLSVEELMKERRDNNRENRGDMENYIRSLDNPKNQKEAVCKWLDRALKAKALADHYIAEKTALTIAGSARMAGAKALREKIRQEIADCKAFLQRGEIENFTVKDAVLKVAYEQTKAGFQPYQKNEDSINTLSDGQKERLKESIYQIMSGFVTKQMLEKENIAHPEYKNADIYSVRASLDQDKNFGKAIDTYLEGENLKISDVMRDLQKNQGKDFMKKLKQINDPKVLRAHLLEDRPQAGANRL